MTQTWYRLAILGGALNLLDLLLVGALRALEAGRLKAQIERMRDE